MRKSIFSIVMLLGTGGLALAQPAEEKLAMPMVLPEPGHAGAGEHTEKEAPRRFSIFPFKKEEGHLPESAEEAEHHHEKKPRLWVRGEYLIWWVRVANFPILVTTGDPADPIPGALSSLNTVPLYGGSGIDFYDRKGGRFSAGWWFDDEQRIGLEVSYAFIGGRAQYRTFISDGAPILATPFFNTATGQPDASLATFPGVMSGQIVVDAPTFFQSIEANMSAALWDSDKFRLEVLGGFRHVNLGETLRIESTSLVGLAPAFVGLLPLDGRTITVSDRFEGRSYFYGGQFGLRSDLHWKRFVLTTSGKLAMGASHQVVIIRGDTNIDTNPATNNNGGLFALSSNDGKYTRNVFAVVPEANLNVAFQLTERLRISAGYSFIYWSNVARPGDQIDTNVNPNFVPTSNTFGAAGGQNRPAFQFKSTSFFAHGINMGLEFRY